jgi:hypothetical protein
MQSYTYLVFEDLVAVEYKLSSEEIINAPADINDIYF